MDSGNLPADYFNTERFFISKNKKLKENGFKNSKYGRPMGKKKTKQGAMVPKTIFYLVLIGILLLLCVILLLVQLGVLQWKQYTTCLPNFTVGNCESMSFLDTYIWSEKQEYNIGTQTCASGVAFRMWSPLATAVSVIVQNETTTATYPMRYSFLTQIFTYSSFIHA